MSDKVEIDLEDLDDLVIEARALQPLNMDKPISVSPAGNDIDFRLFA